MLMRCLHYAPSKIKLLAFNTVVRPIMEYASQVWSPHTKTHSDKLEVILRRAVRWAFHLGRRDSVTDKMTLNKIQTTSSRRVEHDKSFLGKVQCGEYDITLEQYITQNMYNTRNRVIRNQYNTNAFKFSYYNRMCGEVKVFFPDRCPR